MDLSRGLGELAALGEVGAQERMADAALRESLRARVRRGKRRANAIVAASAIAVVAFGAAAIAAPRDDSPPPGPSPSGEPSAHHQPLPKIDTAGYLVDPGGAFVTNEAMGCQQIPDVVVSEDAIPYPGMMPPLPTWIEADRIYGLSDRLTANYPVPLYSRDGAMFYSLAVSEILREFPANAPVTVALIAEDGSWWGFNATYRVLDAMPFDEPGLFVTLTPSPFCKGGARAIDGSRVPPGTYTARVMVARPDGNSVVSDLGKVRIVTGLPSMPSLHVTE